MSVSTAPVEVDSLPSLPVHALKPTHSPHASRDSAEISRSASYTSLPGALETAQGFKRNFSETVLSSLAQTPTKITSSVQNANVELFRRASQKTKKRMSAARFVSANEVEESERSGRSMDKSDAASTKSQNRASGALKMFARKNWLSSSRPQSPTRKVDEKRNSNAALEEKTIAMPAPVATRVSPRALLNSDDSATADQDSIHVRRSSPSPAPPSHATSDHSVERESENGSSRVSRRSSYSSLRSRASLDRMYLSVPSAKVPPLPPSVSPDRLSALSGDSIRKRDPHWVAFRSIDGEYASFQAKTGMQKAKVIRTIMLPFLSKTTDRVTIDSLRAEDLDRRAVILNKWWAGLLDLLNGTGQQAISGTDRLAFLEAICEIMARPEWRMPPFPSSPHEPTESRTKLESVDSQDSGESEEPDFLIKTIHQNVRNMFAQNLAQQMAFVVDRLSMRAAPASMIIFGGKTCAYAFFYCHGYADTLVRLWRVPPGTLRRILNEYGPNTGRKAAAMSRMLTPSFPPPVRTLAFTSPGALSRKLQSNVQIPSNTSHIRWNGPWVNRWCGRDSDLFFVFVKHYHLLAAEHLPRHLLPEERMGIPGFAVVHAQILLNLESALYRQAGNFHAEHYSSQAGENPDAMAPLPMVIPNATRSIGENRLVVLLRDCLGDRRPDNAALAEILIGPFQYILKAAVRKVSMYHNDACFVLCDFLEELQPLIVKYQRVNIEVEDWDFWLKVYKQLLQSESTMTQIRVLAFLYTTWPLVATSDERKTQLLLQWLLEPRFFAQYFNHWSPMVRHYFFRLMCWRVGRSNGPATEVDLEVFKRLSDLLNKSWAHHQYLTADAEMRDAAPPSTNPCSPAPGRALLIIRTDSHSHHGEFTSFDKLMPTGHQSSPYGIHSSMLGKIPEADNQQANTKKKWSLLKSINLFNAPTNHRPGEVTPPRSPDSLNKSQEALSRPSTPPHLSLAFRFSLEYTNTRPGLPNKARKLPPPSLPPTSQKLLDDMNKLQALSSTEKVNKKIAEIHPLKPTSEEMNTARYAGRALAEWHQVVQECRNFYIRRKQEGCPSDAAVETPEIAVESFRMFG